MANKFVQFEFHEEVVISGMIITTYKDYALKKFRVRANNDLNNPNLLTVPNPIAHDVNNHSKSDTIIDPKISTAHSFFSLLKSCKK